MSDTAVAGALAEFVASDRISAVADTSRDTLVRFAVDGLLPSVVVAPANVDELQACLSEAQRTRLAVVPHGRGTQMGLGNVLERYDVALSLAKLNRVIAHVPEDMTLTVEAGATLEDVAPALAAHGQALPVRPASGLAGTVGGMLAGNDQGMPRHGFGTVRDWLIGIAIVQADGTLARAGGRVVKNVAGYDLGKVFIGSLGTLGVIAEATFKLAPLPVAEAGRAVMFASPHAAAMLLLAARDEALALHEAELLSPPAAERVCGERRWAALLRAAGGSGAVARTLRDIDELAAGLHGDVVEVSPAGACASWEACFAPRGLAVRCSVLPSQVADAADALAETDDTLLLSATLGAGVIRVRFGDGHGDARKNVDTARRIVGDFDGHAVIESAPPEVKALFDVFGTPRNDFPIMRRLKDALDPERILSPGRFLGRL